MPTSPGAPPLTAPHVAQSSRGYRSTRQPDGLYTIHDLELFAEHEREVWELGDDGQPRRALKRVDRAWLDQALQLHQLHERERFLAPASVKHHKPGSPEATQVRSAGKVRPTRVETRTYEGKPTAVMIGDLVDVPAEVYAEIRAKGLPYRSAEISPEKPHELACLSLLDHERPFFAFPVLEISQELDGGFAFASARRLPEPRSPVLAYQAAGAGAAVLMRFEADASTEGNMEDVNDAKAQLSEAYGKLLAGFQEMGKMLGIDMGGGDAPAAEPEAMEAEEPKSAEAPAEPPPPGYAARPAASSPATPAPAAAPATYALPPEAAGRIRALELDKERRDRDAAVSAALTRLSRYGFSEADRKDLETYAAQGQLAAYVAGVEKAGVQPPPAGWGGEAMSGAPVAPEQLDAVQRYSARGPDALAEAQRLAHLHSLDASRSVDVATYIAANIDRRHRLPKQTNGTAAR